MKLCAITDRRTLRIAGEEEAVVRRRLLDLVSEWAAGGVDFIQLREKDLSPAELGALTSELLERTHGTRTRLLVNLPARTFSEPHADDRWLREIVSRADGIHLAGKIEPGSLEQIHNAFLRVGWTGCTSVSCHTLEDVRLATAEAADFALFAPVFEKVVAKEAVGGSWSGGGLDPKMAGQGLEALRRASEAAGSMPVFALGGVTAENAAACVSAGAAGVAGIRLFATGVWRGIRGLESS